jgi:predicted phage terminase large subunit-like protein
MKLGAGGTNVEVIGTILHPQSLLAGLLENPGFVGTKYRAVLQFPDGDALPLWQEWRTIFVDLNNATRQADARVFYEAHEEAMLKGTRVLWPERESYYDLMQMRLVEGESSFWLEKMNDPLGDTAYLFKMDEAAYCSVTPMGIVRHGGTVVPWVDVTELCMAYDPTPPKEELRDSDYAAVPVLAQDRTGYLYVLETYLKREPSSDAQILHIVDLAWRWDCKLLSVETNGFASLLTANIREAVRARALAEHTLEFDVQIVPLQNMRSKILRIKSLETLVANGWLQFNKALPQEALTQFAQFIPVEGAGHDDFPDAVEMAIRTIRHQWAKRDIV